MLNQIYIHYINTLFVLESFIISCWLLKGKKIGIGIGIGQFARKKSVSESATKNHDRCITTCGTAKRLNLLFKGIKYTHCLVMLNRCVGFVLRSQSFHYFFLKEKTERQRERERDLKKINRVSPYTNCGLIVYLDLHITGAGAFFPLELRMLEKALWHWLVCWLVESEFYLDVLGFTTTLFIQLDYRSN